MSLFKKEKEISSSPLKSAIALHKVNFDDIVKMPNFKDDFPMIPENYTFEYDTFLSEPYGFCCRCDVCKRNKATDKGTICKLTDISNGSHTFDFLTAAGHKYSSLESYTSFWDKQPVLFLGENPGSDMGEYSMGDSGYYSKRPAVKWCHLPENAAEIEKCGTPEKYIGVGSLANTVAAVIFKYKLANAYFTDLLKCGMTDAVRDKNTEAEERVYLDTDHYQTESKRICIGEVLGLEIEALIGSEKELTVFAFGKNAYALARDYFSNHADFVSGKFAELSVNLIMLPGAGYDGLGLDRYSTIGAIESALKYKESNKPDFYPSYTKKTPKEFALMFSECLGIKINTARRGKNNLMLKVIKLPSLFTDACSVESILLRGNRDTLGGNYEISYNFIDRTVKMVDMDKGTPLRDLAIRKGFLETVDKILSNQSKESKTEK